MATTEELEAGHMAWEEDELTRVAAERDALKRDVAELMRVSANHREGRMALQAKVREFEAWLELATDGELASRLSEDAFNYALNALFAYRSLFGLEAGDA